MVEERAMLVDERMLVLDRLRKEIEGTDNESRHALASDGDIVVLPGSDEANTQGLLIPQTSRPIANYSAVDGYVLLTTLPGARGIDDNRQGIDNILRDGLLTGDFRSQSLANSRDLPNVVGDDDEVTR